MVFTGGSENQIKIIPGFLMEELMVKIYFEYNVKIIETIKTLPGRRWNEDSHYWYIPMSQFDLAAFIELFKGLATIDYSTLMAFEKGLYKPKKVDPDLGRDEQIRHFESATNKAIIKLPEEYLENTGTWC